MTVSCYYLRDEREMERKMRKIRERKREREREIGRQTDRQTDGTRMSYPYMGCQDSASLGAYTNLS